MMSKERLGVFLRKPAVDKLLGGIAVLPSAYVVYLFVHQVLAGNFDIYHAAIAADLLFIVISTLLRRNAVRLSLNPVFWIVTGLRTYWAFVVLKYVYVQMPGSLLQVYVADTLFFAAIAIMLYARVSLGRNIGFVPARRELVTTGAYAYVRHPIHAGGFLYFVSFMLRSPTPLNIVLMTLGILFVAWKSFIEEQFLKDDLDYREYCRRVRFRWIPGLL